MPIDSHHHPAGEIVSDGSHASQEAAPGLIAELVAANHILYDQGVVDAFGHVSVRHDKRPDRFLLARNMAPGSIEADDIIEFDLDGEPVNSRGRKGYLERFIHDEVFLLRYPGHVQRADCRHHALGLTPI
jgi:Class II Aldolase and Adducin N-terminal domain